MADAGRIDGARHEYRLLFPQEITHLLGEKGFTVLGIYDNKEPRETDLVGSEMYTVARYGAGPTGPGDLLQRA